MANRLLTFACLFMCAAALAQTREPGFKTKLSASTVEIKADGSTILTVEDNITISTNQSAMEKSQYTVNVPNPESQFTLVSADVVTGGQTFSAEKNTVQKSVMSDGGHFGVSRSARYVIPLSNVKVGSDIKIKYQVTNKPLVEGVFSTGTGISNGSLGEVETQTFISDVPLRYVTNAFDDFYEVTESKVDGKYKIQLAPTQKGRRLEGKVERIGMLFVSTAKSWSQIDAVLSSKYEQAISAPLPPTFQAIVQAEKSEKSPQVQIEQVADKLHELITYAGDWVTTEGQYFPHGHETVSKTGRGDCKDYSTSMAAILRQLGFNAHVALTSRNVKMPEPTFIKKLADLPEIGFNHAIVWAKDKTGKEWWIDPTNPKVIANVLSLDILGGFALVLDGTSGSVQMLPTRNDISGKWEIYQTVKVNIDDSVDVEAKIGVNPTAYNALAMVENRVGKDNMKDVLSRILQPGARAIASYRLSKIKDQIFYEVSLHSSDWVREQKGRSLEVYVNQFANLPFRSKIREGQDWDMGEEGHALVQTTIKGQKAVDPVNNECLVRSKWLDFERVVDIKDGDTLVKDDVEFKQRYVSEAEAKGDEFKSLVSSISGCVASSLILTKLDSSQRTLEQAELDKLKGPDIEKMTESDAEKIRENFDQRVGTYLTRKLFKFESKRIAAGDNVADAYCKRSRALRNMGYMRREQYLTGYLDAALEDIRHGMTSPKGKSNCNLLYERISGNILKQNLNEATRDFGTLYASAPNQYDTLIAGFQLNKNLKKPADAEKWLRLAVWKAQTELEKTSGRRALANFLQDQNRHNEAAKVFAEIISQAIVSPWDYHNAAIEFRLQKNYDKAIELEKKALNLMDFGAARSELALALVEKAQMIMSNAMINTPTDEPNRKIISLAPHEDVQPLYAEAVKWDDRNIDALLGMARAVLSQYIKNNDEGTWQEAKSYAERALVLEPTNNSVIMTLKNFDNMKKFRHTRIPASAHPTH